ncbi:glycosyltransferase family 2 protein [Bifidobacterium felsineum]|nr:glycosyltransferase [Bifidobacterium felsineum]
MPDKVSIIVAIYKSEKFLDKCINSITNQTYTNLEIILVDDGSPDNSGAICDRHAQQDNRIKVIHKKNGGTCDARNAGLAAATGDWIVIVDGDDWLSEDYIAYLMDMAQKTKAEMVMTENIFTTRDQTQVEHDEIRVKTPEDAVASLLYPKIVVGPWNKMYKHSMLQEHHLTFSVPWSGEGLYFATMSAQYANKVAVGQRKIYNYRLNNMESGLTHYNVQMGINALWNIKNIKNKLVVRTPKTINAANWHIWKNYNYLLFLIVATDSKAEHKDLYQDCLSHIRSLLPRTLLTADLGLKTKAHMLITGLMPNLMAKHELAKAKAALAKDTFK